MRRFIVKFFAVLFVLLPLHKYSAKLDIDIDEIINEHGAMIMIIEVESGSIVHANNVTLEFYGYSYEEITSMKIQNINQLSAYEVEEEMQRAIAEERNYFEFKHKIASGAIKSVEIYSHPFEENGKQYLLSVVFDATEKHAILENRANLLTRVNYVIVLMVLILMLVIIRLMRNAKENELLRSKLSRLSYTDKLTGLENRCNIEVNYNNLVNSKNSFGLYVLDTDGLKLVNDAFGHNKGDLVIKGVANRLKELCDENSHLIRMSGDEFIVLVPSISRNDYYSFFKKLCGITVEIEGVKVTVSVGAFFVEDDLDYYYVFKRAEDEMYKHKLANKLRSNERIVDNVLSNLFKVSKISEEHSNKVKEYSSMIIKKLIDDPIEIQMVERAALLHDIGRIALNIELLDSSYVFEEDDKGMIKKHAEKGYNILKGIKGYHKIAESTLHHHERFDGSGYPLGLRGKAIPFYSRVIAVADAFDGMTGTRYHRDRLKVKEAIQELRDRAGTQFDPEMVEIFVKCLEDNEIKV